MDRKLLNKVMKRLASSNVVKESSEKSASSSLSAHKESDTEQVQQKMEQYLLNRYHFPLQCADRTNGIQQEGQRHTYI